MVDGAEASALRHDDALEPDGLEGALAVDEQGAVADAVPEGRAVNSRKGDGLPATPGCPFGRARLRAPVAPPVTVNFAVETVPGQRLDDLFPGLLFSDVAIFHFSNFY